MRLVALSADQVQSELQSEDVGESLGESEACALHTICYELTEQWIGEPTWCIPHIRLLCHSCTPLAVAGPRLAHITLCIPFNYKCL